mmetsp:Transcript_51417/g.88164  ORF Transcript_51417/g.88164 Transcript_51417/m.88164 type:complete len:237 (-) Transcript_51417:60-770(-)
MRAFPCTLHTRAAWPPLQIHVTLQVFLLATNRTVQTVTNLLSTEHLFDVVHGAIGFHTRVNERYLQLFLVETLVFDLVAKGEFSLGFLQGWVHAHHLFNQLFICVVILEDRSGNRPVDVALHNAAKVERVCYPAIHELLALRITRKGPTRVPHVFSVCLNIQVEQGHSVSFRLHCTQSLLHLLLSYLVPTFIDWNAATFSLCLDDSPPNATTSGYNTGSSWRQDWCSREGSIRACC